MHTSGCIEGMASSCIWRPLDIKPNACDEREQRSACIYAASLIWYLHVSTTSSLSLSLSRCRQCVYRQYQHLSYSRSPRMCIAPWLPPSLSCLGKTLVLRFVGVCWTRSEYLTEHCQVRFTLLSGLAVLITCMYACTLYSNMYLEGQARAKSYPCFLFPNSVTCCV